MKPKSLKFVFPLLLTIVGLVWVGLSVFTYGLYNSAGPLPGFFPCMVGAAIAFVSFLDFLNALKAEKSAVKAVMFLPFLGVAAVIAASFLVGTVPALFILLAAWLRGYEKFSWKTTALTSAIVVAVVWLVFVYWIQVDFETGLLPLP